MAAIRMIADTEVGKVEETVVGHAFMATLYAAVTLEISDDGAVQEISRDAPRKTANPALYFHLTETPAEAPTEAQRAILGRRWIKGKACEIIPASLGADVCRWAFGGMTPQELSNRYGDGAKVYLA
ncbi:hypothetical protein SAMN05444389_101461 [Paracoccus solventivorans]|uniref:Uncharacterized protein n=1 Tax=Paracoccus solventivorans TaxID=53463 RepID=A0A1M7DND4_9RHOB|nr:hypothetical protein [Paracoccus solventivorans]SHL81006.1 hypothetical protein SAMN05444389_101461 [Paracoccus solventivorans]